MNTKPNVIDNKDRKEKVFTRPSDRADDNRIWVVREFALVMNSLLRTTSEADYLHTCYVLSEALDRGKRTDQTPPTSQAGAEPVRVKHWSTSTRETEYIDDPCREWREHEPLSYGDLKTLDWAFNPKWDGQNSRIKKPTFAYVARLMARPESQIRDWWHASPFGSGLGLHTPPEGD